MHSFVHSLLYHPTHSLLLSLLFPSLRQMSAPTTAAAASASATASSTASQPASSLKTSTVTATVKVDDIDLSREITGIELHGYSSGFVDIAPYKKKPFIKWMRVPMKHASIFLPLVYGPGSWVCVFSQLPDYDTAPSYSKPLGATFHRIDQKGKVQWRELTCNVDATQTKPERLGAARVLTSILGTSRPHGWTDELLDIELEQYVVLRRYQVKTEDSNKDK